MPFVRRTRATFRSAEFGFFGVRVITWRHTPRRWGAPRPIEAVCSRVLRVRRSAGAFTFLPAGLRPLRTSWLIVGNRGPRVRSLNRKLLLISRPRQAHGEPETGHS